MTSLLNITQTSPSLGTLCTTIILSLSFGIGVGMYTHYLTPTFVSMYGTFDRDSLAGMLLPYLQSYLSQITEVLSQALQCAAVSVIPSLPMDQVIWILQYLAPLIETHESLFELVGRLVSYLDNTNSVYYVSFNNIWEDMREIGNQFVEIYRALEEAAGIPINQSRIPEQWFEN